MLWRQRILSFVAVVFLLLAIFFSFRWMVAGLYAERIALSLQSWIINNETPNGEILENHLEFAAESSLWAPSNARNKELEARIRLIRLPKLSSNKEILEELEIILNLHRKAVDNRPGWAISWSNIVYIKGIKREYDEEYQDALRQTFKYGPYLTDSLFRLIYSGVNGWERLDDESRQLVALAVVNFLEISRSQASQRNLRQTIEQAGKLPEVCRITNFHSEEVRARICE